MACGNMPLLSMVDRQIKHAVFGASRLTLVAPCEWLRRRVSRGVLGEKQIEVIPCGVEPGRFEGISGRAVREKLGVPEDARVVLFAGNMLTNIKGHEDLLRMARRILATERDVWFVLVGPHGKLPLRHRQVVFTGRVEPAEMTGYYAAADVFAYPTHGDVFPVVVLEALASARPVVTHRIRGLSELPEEGAGVFLVEEHDEGTFEERLRRVIADRELARSMGEAGRERVRGFFTVEQQARKTEALYERVVGRNGKA
jgi:glycosyltransferase involved in cell wall biosynthesis